MRLYHAGQPRMAPATSQSVCSTQALSGTSSHGCVALAELEDGGVTACESAQSPIPPAKLKKSIFTNENRNCKTEEVPYGCRYFLHIMMMA